MWKANFINVIISIELITALYSDLGSTWSNLWYDVLHVPYIIPLTLIWVISILSEHNKYYKMVLDIFATLDIGLVELQGNILMI